MAALYLTVIGAFVLAVIGLWDTLHAPTRRAGWEEQHHAAAVPLMALSGSQTVLQHAKNMPLVHANRRTRADRARDHGVEVVA